MHDRPHPLYLREKQAHGGDRKSSGQFDHSIKSAQKIAQECGVSMARVCVTIPDNAEKIMDREGMVQELMTKIPPDPAMITDGTAKPSWWSRLFGK